MAIDNIKWSNNFKYFLDFAAGKNDDDDRIQLTPQQQPDDDQIRRTQPSPNQPISPKNLNLSVSRERENIFQRAFRSFDDSIANERAREVFKNTICEIYGGEERIPQPVKDAMKLKYFDNMGRPLTARRVRAVINAMVPSLSLEQISQEFVNTTENHSKNLMLQYFFCKLATQCVTSKEKDYSPNTKQQDLTRANRILTFGQNKIPNGFQEIKDYITQLSLEDFSKIKNSINQFSLTQNEKIFLQELFQENEIDSNKAFNSVFKFQQQGTRNKTEQLNTETKKDILPIDDTNILDTQNKKKGQHILSIADATHTYLTTLQNKSSKKQLGLTTYSVQKLCNHIQQLQKNLSIFFSDDSSQKENSQTLQKVYQRFKEQKNYFLLTFPKFLKKKSETFDNRFRYETNKELVKENLRGLKNIHDLSNREILDFNIKYLKVRSMLLMLELEIKNKILDIDTGSQIPFFENKKDGITSFAATLVEFENRYFQKTDMPSEKKLDNISKKEEGYQDEIPENFDKKETSQENLEGIDLGNSQKIILENDINDLNLMYETLNAKFNEIEEIVFSDSNLPNNIWNAQSIHENKSQENQNKNNLDSSENAVNKPNIPYNGKHLQDSTTNIVNKNNIPLDEKYLKDSPTNIVNKNNIRLDENESLDTSTNIVNKNNIPLDEKYLKDSTTNIVNKNNIRLDENESLDTSTSIVNRNI